MYSGVLAFEYEWKFFSSDGDSGRFDVGKAKHVCRFLELRGSCARPAASRQSFGFCFARMGLNTPLLLKSRKPLSGTQVSRAGCDDALLYSIARHSLLARQANTRSARSYHHRAVVASVGLAIQASELCCHLQCLAAVGDTYFVVSCGCVRETQDLLHNPMPPSLHIVGVCLPGEMRNVCTCLACLLKLFFWQMLGVRLS